MGLGFEDQVADLPSQEWKSRENCAERGTDQRKNPCGEGEFY